MDRKSFKDISLYIMSNAGKEFSAQNIANYYSTQVKKKVSTRTIYNELLIQGFSVYPGKTFKGEIDFVAIKENKKCFIQVAYLLLS